MKTLTLALGLALATTGLAAQAEEMNDLEIAHAAYTAGVLDIRYAHLALAISENEAVLDFARTMIRDHSAVNDAAGALIAELDVTPQDNALSQALVDGAAAKRAELTALTGNAFDGSFRFEVDPYPVFTFRIDIGRHGNQGHGIRHSADHPLNGIRFFLGGGTCSGKQKDKKEN